MKRNEKILKKKSIDIKIIILIDIVLLIAVFFAYKNIYTVETRKTIYAEASEKFVEENKQPVFKIGKIILYSSANAIDNSDGQLKDIDIVSLLICKYILIIPKKVLKLQQRIQ